MIVSLCDSTLNSIVLLKIVNNSMLNEETRRIDHDITIQSEAFVTKRWGRSKIRNLQNFNNHNKSNRKEIK